MRKQIALMCGLAAAAATQAAQVDIRDNFINAGETKVINAADDNFLHEMVFVESGATLIIEAGAVIRAIPSWGPNVASIIVCRGGKIYAQGTVDKPIIFTIAADDLNDPRDYGPGAHGLWGGLVVAGYAPIDRGTKRIEGVDPNDDRGIYGGDNEDDSSGVIKFISIRHGGCGVQSDKEINGLTLCGVGRKTVIDYVDVFANADDGVEFFGGTVGVKHASVAFCGDDAFDYDDGWRGKGQYWFSIANNIKSRFANSDHGYECDGVDGEQYTLFSKPVISNYTVIGQGKNNVGDQSVAKRALSFIERCGGQLYNGIVGEWPRKAVLVRAQWTDDSHTRWMAGDLFIKNTFFYNFGAGNTWAAICEGWSQLPTEMPLNNNWIRDPQLRGLSRDNADPFLDPRPAVRSPACSTAYINTAVASDPWFATPQWVGAFGPGMSLNHYWIKKWTSLAQNNVAAKLLTISPRHAEWIASGATNFDLLFELKVANAQLNSYQVLLDNVDVSASFQARSVSSTITAGGTCYKIPNLPVTDLGSVGWHNLQAKFIVTVPGQGKDTLVDKVSYYRVQ